ncbi:5-oxoprolinase subunit B family protein [Micromonospora chokoriensis]|uniref:Sensor histidine kinase inhibitor, KipI family n=1 Tax=Micromonospora chokoriensis TaxID=356851 RepID=A0A1C4V6B8_9ACTN|nr:carboxyltransferase domain-containing protein [Micromonospora chokoriensis]SCE79497.1 sensor histidine kinase inhibitor, KipI family [Micromonospora chokoriensis]
MRIRPVGAHALLLDCTTTTDDGVPDDVPEVDLVEAWRAELWRRREQGDLVAVEIVPAAGTVLLDGLPDPSATAEQLARWAGDVAAATNRPDRLAAPTAAPPADGDATAPPADGDATARPADGDATAPPADGDATARPADGDATARPADGDATARATDRDATALPADRDAVARVSGLDATAGTPDRAATEVVVPVCFDGPDLPTVAEYWNVDVPTVLRRLTSTRFRVAFCGFAPGFPYLTGLPAELALPRLATPRPRVPAGSVALAGPYAGIYPGASPGGWQLVGRTELVLFDVHADPPARLGPGTSVRMVAT